MNEHYTLSNVLYVPDLAYNLLSVSTLTSSGCKALFTEDMCKITWGEKTVIVGRKHGKLYRVIVGDAAKMATTETETNVFPKSKALPLSLWHARLGHLNFAGVQRLSKMARGIEIQTGDAVPGVCSACLEGKQHKRYNRNSPAKRASERLELVHSDSCGPFRTRSISGARYFILFIDDFSRMVWCYFLKQKNGKETLEAFSEFKALCEKHSGKQILRFRCDNGRAEYNNYDFQMLLKKEGITYEPSAPYTQNQNGVSEHMIRTLVEKARTMLLEAKLLERFWAEAVNTAVFLRNRSPTKALEGKTPYEV
jgi:transposase InsO family protein